MIATRLFRLFQSVTSVVILMGALCVGRTVSLRADQEPLINRKCGGSDGLNTMTCPDSGICQYSGHCNIPNWHKCISSETFKICEFVYNHTCAPLEPKDCCKWRQWSVNCAMNTGPDIEKCCYFECEKVEQ